MVARPVSHKLPDMTNQVYISGRITAPPTYTTNAEGCHHMAFRLRVENFFRRLDTANPSEGDHHETESFCVLVVVRDRRPLAPLATKIRTNTVVSVLGWLCPHGDGQQLYVRARSIQVLAQPEALS